MAKDLVTICHKPDGAAETLQVAPEAVASHLAHGDHLGPCVQDVEDKDKDKDKEKDKENVQGKPD